MKNDKNLEQDISEKDKNYNGTYMIEGLIFGMLAGTIIGIFFGFGSMASFVAPGFGLLAGLIIGMLIKKKR